MNLTRLQKIALVTTGAAAAYKALLYSLGLHVDSSLPLSLPWLAIDVAAALRVIFALLSFVAFDLVLVSVVIDLRTHGFAWPGAVAGAVAAVVSAALALQVADVLDVPALHATPAATMLAYAAHLVLSHAPARAPVAAAPQPAAGPAAAAAAVTIINAPTAQAAAAPPQLPRTVREFIAARARELGTDAPAVLAQELGTSPDTVRRALALIQSQEAEDGR